MCDIIKTVWQAGYLVRVFRITSRGVKLDSALTKRDCKSNSKKQWGVGVGLSIHLMCSSGQIMFYKTGLQVRLVRQRLTLGTSIHLWISIKATLQIVECGWVTVGSFRILTLQYWVIGSNRHLRHIMLPLKRADYHRAYALEMKHSDAFLVYQHIK